MGLPQGELASADIKTRMYTELEARVADLRMAGEVVAVALLNPDQDNLPSQTYVDLKTRAALKVGIVPHTVSDYSAGNITEWIDYYGEAQNTQGVVVQLPLREDERDLTDSLLSRIKPEKDVDGLRPEGDSPFAPATPTAILTLLEGHGVDLSRESVTILGQGKLVGAPLFKMLTERGVGQIQAVDKDTPELERVRAIDEGSIVISAMGLPRGLTRDLFELNDGVWRPRVIVDAGVAEDGGATVGDVDPALREFALRMNWGITPLKGGVGPLTVASLLTNVVEAAERVTT